MFFLKKKIEKHQIQKNLTTKQHILYALNFVAIVYDIYLTYL